MENAPDFLQREHESRIYAQGAALPHPTESAHLTKVYVHV